MADANEALVEIRNALDELLEPLGDAWVSEIKINWTPLTGAVVVVISKHRDV